MSDTSRGDHLYLYCTDLEYFPQDHAAFIQSCQDNALLGEPGSNLGANRYQVGDDFLKHVTFLGCSPYLKIYPEHDDDSDYCSAYIPDKTRPVRFVAGRQVTVPRCPACKKAIPSGLDVVEAWRTDPHVDEVHCQHCGRNSDLYQLDWRRNAGFINFAISISNIFPKEAIPSQGLLDWLHSISGREWRYFYA